MSDEITRHTDCDNYIYRKFSRLVISPRAIAHNIDVIRSITGRTIIAVVKENGYGMGLWNEYQILKDLDIRFYAVTNAREALALRKFGCDKPILLMSPAAEYEDCLELAKQDIIFSLEADWQIPLLERVYQETDIAPRVHLKIETGMGRYGFLWNQLPDLTSLTAFLSVEGCFTHLAGRPKKYRQQAEQQRQRLLTAVSALEAMGIPTGIKHISNSSAVMTVGDLGMDAVRVGSALLGKTTVYGKQALGNAPLKSAVWLEAPVYEIRSFRKGDTIGYQSHLTLKRDSRLALVRIGHTDGIYLGYGDFPEYFFHGLLHLLSLKLRPGRYRKMVTVNGKQAPLAGLLGVAHMMIDVTDIPCQTGDPVTLQVNPLLIHPAVPKVILPDTEQFPQ